MTDRGPADTIARFDNRADAYVRFRPGYPAQAIDAAIAGLEVPSRLIAADIGAGTGISARLLADRGVRVIAIEPGQVMRAAAAPHPNVRWVAGAAGATGLASASVGLVLCAQSYHWFQTAAALREFARILRPAGRLALMWNQRSRIDPFTAGFRQAITAVGGESSMERLPFNAALVDESGLFTPIQRHGWPNEQVLSLDALIGRAQSASHVPLDGPDGARIVQLLTDLHARYADAEGHVRLVYETELYTCSARA